MRAMKIFPAPLDHHRQSGLLTQDKLQQLFHAAHAKSWPYFLLPQQKLRSTRTGYIFLSIFELSSVDELFIVICFFDQSGYQSVTAYHLLSSLTSPPGRSPLTSLINTSHGFFCLFCTMLSEIFIVNPQTDCCKKTPHQQFEKYTNSYWSKRITVKVIEFKYLSSFWCVKWCMTFIPCSSPISLGHCMKKCVFRCSLLVS